MIVAPQPRIGYGSLIPVNAVKEERPHGIPEGELEEGR